VVLVDAGPVAAHLAEELKAARDITIITNSVTVFDILNRTPGITLISTGGAVRYSSQTLVGPTAEGTLKELRDAGKIRHIGLSNISVAELERAEKVAPIVSVQNLYNAADRSSEDVLRACEQRGIPFLPWFPLQAGRAEAPVDTLAELLRHSPVMLPIPGTSSVAHLEQNMRAAKLAD